MHIERERVNMKKLWSTSVAKIICWAPRGWRRVGVAALQELFQNFMKSFDQEAGANCLSNGWLLALLAIFFLCQSPETGNCVLNILQPKPSEELPGKWLLCLHLGSLGLTGLQVNIRIFKRSNHKRPNLFLWALMEGADKDFEQQLTNMMTSLGCSRDLVATEVFLSYLGSSGSVMQDVYEILWAAQNQSKPSRFVHLARYLPEFRELSGWPSNLGWLGFWFWGVFLCCSLVAILY